MIELCEIIYYEGHPVPDEPELRMITFGELFQIYTKINDKVAGLLLRARLVFYYVQSINMGLNFAKKLGIVT
jgi:hypothetical protein